MVCSSVLFKPKTKCNCGIETRYFLNGRMIKITYDGKGFHETGGTPSHNVYGVLIDCDSISVHAVE